MVSFASHFASPPKQVSHASHPLGSQAVYVGGHRVLLRTLWGHKMLVDSRDLSVAPHLILDGHWEMWISNVFRALVRPDMRIVEVGANFGYYTLLAADLVGPNGHVTSFEANPHMAKFVRDNLDINGLASRATVLPVAAYSEASTLKFAVFRDHMASSSLYATDQSAAAVADTLTVREVQALPIDSIVKQGDRVDLLKIDAEGAELDVLAGARRVLAENRDILLVVEHGPDLLAHVHDGKPSALFDHCAALGMNCYAIRNDSQIELCDFDRLLQFGHCDAVFTRRQLG